MLSIHKSSSQTSHKPFRLLLALQFDMRFYLPFVIVTALVGLAFANPIPSLETRQQPPEAVRFGVVNVEPTTFKVNEPFTVIYNSTFARWQPLTLDIYMHGVYPNGFVTPDFQLLRTDYPSDAHVYYLNTTVSSPYSYIRVSKILNGFTIITVARSCGR
ncbi:hypothetical protein BC629DRAFT_6455 [Irpex lacteus]|nr:hypothetical protein BC629DRAFT_6455 [Irpex lacteus]